MSDFSSSEFQPSSASRNCRSFWEHFKILMVKTCLASPSAVSVKFNLKFNFKAFWEHLDGQEVSGMWHTPILPSNASTYKWSERASEIKKNHQQAIFNLLWLCYFTKYYLWQVLDVWLLFQRQDWCTKIEFASCHVTWNFQP